MSRRSPRKSTHEELLAASQAVKQEYNAVKRLKRLSIGNSLNFDPDLPPEEMDFEDLTYNDLQPHNNPILNNQSYQDKSNKELEPSPLNNDDDIEDSDLDDENDEFYDVDKMDFLDIDPDSSLTDSNMIWVPATAHPKLAPDNFRKHVQKAVKEINTKLQRANSVKSSLGIESTNVIEEEEEDNDGSNFIDASEGDKENTTFLPKRKKSSASNENEQTRKPSLRELTEQLENLSQIAGLGSDDAVTLARSLSTKSIGISKIEKDVYNNSDIQPKKPSGSPKYSFHNKKVRASLYFEDDEDDDNTGIIDDLDERLIQLDLKENQKNSSIENPLRRTKWSNYRKNSNKIQDLPKAELHSIHVYKDIQKIHNNVKRPLGKPQIETIKSKSPSSKLPALPSKQVRKQINPLVNGVSKSNGHSSKSLPATPIMASKPAIPTMAISAAPANNNTQNNPYSSYVSNHSASSLNSAGSDLNTKYQPKSQSHSQVQQIIHSQAQSQKSPRSSSWGWLTKNKEKDSDKLKEKDKEEEREKGKDDVTDSQGPANHSRHRHMGTISDHESSKKLTLDTDNLGVKQADAHLTSKSEESIILTLNSEKEKEEDKVKEKKPSFTSFFKLKRDKQRTNSDVNEDTEPRLGFKKKRSQSHSTEASSPKSDFKSFFSGKNHKENKEKKEQPGFGAGNLSIKIPTSTNSSPLPSPNASTTSLSLSNDNFVENSQLVNDTQPTKANKQCSQLATEQLKSDSKSSTSPAKHLPQYQIQHQHQHQHQQQAHLQSQHQSQTQLQHQGHQQSKIYNSKQSKQSQRPTQSVSPIHNRSVQEQQNPFPLSHSAQSNGAQRKLSQNQQKSHQHKHQPKLKNKSQIQPQLKSRMQPQAEVQPQIQIQPQLQVQTQLQTENELPSQSHSQAQIQSQVQVQPQTHLQSQTHDSDKSVNLANLSEEVKTSSSAATNSPSTSDNATQILKETLKVSSRPYKPNQPLEMRESAFGFPLPPVSHSTLVMLDYRLPIHVERAIYRLSHLKLADPKRPLYQQVLLSNFMYSYLNLVNHTLYLQQQEQAQDNDENGLIPAAEEEPLNSTNYPSGLVGNSL